MRCVVFYVDFRIMYAVTSAQNAGMHYHHLKDGELLGERLNLCSRIIEHEKQ